MESSMCCNMILDSSKEDKKEEEEEPSLRAFYLHSVLLGELGRSRDMQ